MSKPIVCIMGGGVGGLSTAHQLVDLDQYEIHVIERNDTCGGQARSMVSDGKHTEYCWHAFSSGYRNLRGVMNTLQQWGANFDLKPFEQYVYFTKNGKYTERNRNFLTSRTFFSSLWKISGEFHPLDYIKGLLLYFKANAMCNERLESYDFMTWEKYVESFSPAFKRWVVDGTSIYLGMKYDTLSAHTMLDLMRHNGDVWSSKYDFFALNGPINEKLFDPWQQYLRLRGVIFHMNTDITDFSVANNEIRAIVLKDKWTSTSREMKADYFVNSLSIESFAYLLSRTNTSYAIPFETLAELGHQIQTQILYRLPTRLNEHLTTVYIFGETPWFLMVRHEGSFWNLKENDLLSAGIGIWNRPGLNGKCAIECTPEELALECWNQITASTDFFQKECPEWDIWDHFVFSQGKLGTWEPKFSNTVGTYNLRPSTRDPLYLNLFHATGYTRTSMNLFNMEAACEAGIQAAKSISKDETPTETSYRPNWFWRCLQWLDKTFFY